MKKIKLFLLPIFFITLSFLLFKPNSVLATRPMNPIDVKQDSITITWQGNPNVDNYLIKWAGGGITNSSYRSNNAPFTFTISSLAPGDTYNIQAYDCFDADPTQVSLLDCTALINEIDVTTLSPTGVPPTTTGGGPLGNLFGQVTAPGPVAALGSGAVGISKLINNLITLIYTIAAIVFIFMLLWSAFDWMTSGGNKEKLAAAQGRLTWAFVGIILFAIAFAIFRVLGIFTGFTFFVNQGVSGCEDKYYRDTLKQTDASGNKVEVKDANGNPIPICVHHYFTDKSCSKSSEVFDSSVSLNLCP